MIIVHRLCPQSGDKLVSDLLRTDEPLPADALWIDMLQPTREEDHQVEALLGTEIPTREDMYDIEPSELLWNENGAVYMTARILMKVELGEPEMTGVTFILKENILVTVRYGEPKSFAMFTHRAMRPGGCGKTSEAVMAGLIEAIIDRAADVLQDTGASIDALSRSVFAEPVKGGARTHQYQTTLRALGRHGDLISKTRESLVSIERILLFLSATFRSARVPLKLREEVKTTLRDLQSLEEHASFLSNKIQFLLDATLGLVNLEQNNIIKLFSVMAVIFMPPTLVASIYGMNFKLMPELEWTLGYPFALLLMVLVGVTPYFFFRWKNWL